MEVKTECREIQQGGIKLLCEKCYMVIIHGQWDMSRMLKSLHYLKKWSFYENLQLKLANSQVILGAWLNISEKMNCEELI